MDGVARKIREAVGGPWAVRPFRQTDMPSLASLEARVYGAGKDGGKQDGVHEPLFVDLGWLLQNHVQIDLAMPLEGSEPVGYCAWQHKTLKKVLIGSMGVVPGSRRQGCGTSLLARVKRRVASKEKAVLMAIVPESALAAQLFFRSAGFVATEVVGANDVTCREASYRMIWRGEWAE